MTSIITATQATPPPSGQPPEITLVSQDVEGLAEELVA